MIIYKYLSYQGLLYSKVCNVKVLRKQVKPSYKIIYLKYIFIEKNINEIEWKTEKPYYVMCK